MPVIVVGADTPLGEAVMDELLPRDSQVRAFVSSPQAAAALKQRGVKVALGDVSDGSHVGGAALNVFCAVLIHEAASDDRERSFASDPAGVLAAWAEGINDAEVTRTIVVWDEPPSAELASIQSETVVVTVGDRLPETIAAEVGRLEDIAEL
ncbi:MAG: hypothetical protein HKN91_04050 [Acidimicrobiia bacterium]|nr:hypothetical protein [Acidimicrobiia bacterium]